MKRGDDARHSNRFAESSAFYAAARDLAAKAGDLKTEGSALLRMATSDYFGGRYEDSGKHAAEALAIHEKLGNKVAQASDLRIIGDYQYSRGDYAASRATQERALGLHTEIGDRKGVADDLANIAVTMREIDALGAIDYLDRAQREFEALQNHRNRAITLNSLGSIYQTLGDADRGEEYFRLALSLAEKAKDVQTQGEAMNNLGILETYRGNYRVAFGMLERALDLHRGFDWGEALDLQGLGALYSAQGNHAQAIAQFDKALELNRRIGDKNLQAGGELAVAEEYLAMNNRAEAAKRFGRCLELSRANSYAMEAALALSGLARVHERARAREELDEAIGIERGLSDKLHLAGTLVQSGGARLAEGGVEAALAAAKEAGEIAEASGLPDVLWQARLLEGRCLRREGKASEAAKAFEASIAAIESLRTNVAGPPTALPVYFADKLEAYRERVELAMDAGQPRAALEFAERAKSRALGDILRSARIDPDKAMTPAEKAEERRLQNRLASLNIRAAKGRPGVGREIAAARRDLEAFQTGIYAAHPETAFDRGVSNAGGAEQLLGVAADAHAAILDYFATAGRVYVFAISSRKELRVVRLREGPAALNRKATEFHRQLASHDLGYAAAARDLYDTLVKPLDTFLAAEKAVVISPDGALWQAPFHALQPGPKRFWIEDKAVTYAPSIHVLAETMRMARGRQSAEPTLLAVGDANEGERIPEARSQMDQIGKLYGPGKSLVLAGGDATEARFRAEAGRYRVIHIASHGILDDANPMYSKILLTGSGADDGFLEARELMRLNLNAELLVLSACETAGGLAAGGEGVNGMLWAAFVAGAPTTLASLWRVESGSSAGLTTAFHRNWLRAGDRGSKAEAMRAAARESIADQRYSHPFYWAGFIVAGSPN